MPSVGGPSPKGRRERKPQPWSPSPRRLAQLRVRAAEASARLHAAYGSPNHNNKADPLDELIFIILSQMTTHHSFGRVFDRLKLWCPHWEDVLALPPERLAEIIKDAGLSNQKVPRIIAILGRIQSDFDKLSLDALREMTDAAAEAYLTGLPGVGVKTAKCVLMYSLGRDVLPVDTHVARVASRLGLLSPRTPAAHQHSALESVVAPQDRFSFHVNSMCHGREICRAVRPLCETCPLLDICPLGRRRIRM
jgi:endonuclease III